MSKKPSCQNAIFFSIYLYIRLPYKANGMENQILYITTKEGLEEALRNVLSTLNLIQPSDQPVRHPATRQQAAKFLNISLNTVDNLIKYGQIKAFNIGRRVRIDWSELENLVKDQPRG